MNSICHYCQGESHKSTNKPCQDYAYAESSEMLSMAIVSDGHGGERYFRSQYGSEMAVKVTKEAIRVFVENMEQSSFTPQRKRSVFEDTPFTAYSSATATEQQEHTNAHKALTWLFSHIITQWNQSIAQHARENDLTEWEQEHVEQKYKDDFLVMRESEDASFEKTYGCTLMAYVQTPAYWFAFHLGDGKCVSMRIADNKLVCEQPIPWDEKCFLNKTTSLCDSNAIEEFRYCYQGNGEFPRAVFLGSDGIDDSYGDGEILNNFYIQLFKLIIRRGKESAEKELKKSLPIISQRGSKDDMSVACVFDDSALNAMHQYLTAYQQNVLEQDMAAIEEKRQRLEQKIADFGNPEKLDKPQLINLEYAKKDLAKAEEQAKRLKKRLASLKGEITKFNNQMQKDILADDEPQDEISLSSES
ncbi:MAG: protein phosphatase 2C domain-containing protein [Prevotella sp.]|nr:protein phosphatase 2C domain-containing protein [Prevotella sp.]